MTHDMADQSNMSQGMKFAVDLLRKQGWTEGKGLGKHEDGISEALKVRVKSDAAGVGHDSAEQFTFHWWDHVFNKTASSISVETDQDGVQVKRLTADETTVSNKKPRKALTYNNMLYGRFIKTATLLSGGEKPVEEASPSDTSDSSEDEDAKLDLSSATKLTDEDLMRVCGGRTAHKGARHGLTMSAKLSRIEEQERAFLEKYGKKEPSKSNLKLNSTAEDTGVGLKMNKQIVEADAGGIQDISSATLVPKKKKKNKTKKGDCGEEMENEVAAIDQHSTEERRHSTKKKKKKRNMVDHDEQMIGDQNSLEEEYIDPKKKRNMVDHDEEMIGDQNCLEEENIDPTKKKKKRKKADRGETMENTNEEEAEELTKKKSNRKTIDLGGEMGNEETIGDELAIEEEYSESTKKKKKKRKMVDHEVVGEEMELNGLSHEEARRPSQKNKKWRTDEDQKHGKGDEGEQCDKEKEEGKSKKKKRQKRKDEEEKAEVEEPEPPAEDVKLRKKKRKHNKERSAAVEEV